MPTIVIQALLKAVPIGGPVPLTTTAVVAASPGRIHYATIGGIPRDLELVGVDASGQSIYRDQNRL